MSTGLVADPVCEEHEPGPRHPECPGRLNAVRQALAQVSSQLTPIPARDATIAELRLAHTAGYLQLAQSEIAEGATDLSTGDTQVGARSWVAALRACGGVLNAVDAVMRGEVNNAFSVHRPPGHHATADRGMGFCIVNHVAVAAQYAQRVHGLERVLIIDWDVHHGNGTQDIFYDDPTVFFFSSHEWPLYPGTGSARETGSRVAQGTTMNRPLPSGTTGAELRTIFERDLQPAAEKFAPELILISAGFDSRKEDPLGHFELEDEDFAELTRIVRRVADRSAQGRIVSLLEGGYNLRGLGLAAAAHVAALLE